MGAPQSVLETLSDAQQRELYNALAYKFSGKANNNIRDLDEELWNALSVALGNRIPPPFAPFRTSFGASNYTMACDRFYDFITSGSPRAMRKVVRVRVAEECFRAMIEHLRDIHLAPCPTTILRNLDRLPYAVDCSWPGYARARLLHRVTGM